MTNYKPNFQKIKYQLNIMLSNEDEQIKSFYQKFILSHNGDSGIDLYNKQLVVDPFLVGTINFNIKCEMLDLENNEYTSYYLVPRSSLAKTSFQLANSIGIIDAGYRGDLMAKIRNFNSKESESLPEGSYFQIIAPDLKPIKINIVNELSSTSRGSGGFGSTKENNYILYFDGCCKGNPGQGACGAVLYHDSQILWFSSQVLDETTNNRAEYNGLILGLLEVEKRAITNLIVKGDSKLVINHMLGINKVKSKDLELLYENAKKIISNMNKIEFIHIKRSENKYADKIANDALKK
jgi:ribonuclease HI/dUTPase